MLVLGEPAPALFIYSFLKFKDMNSANKQSEILAKSLNYTVAYQNKLENLLHYLIRVDDDNLMAQWFTPATGWLAVSFRPLLNI